jgi:hypothetical protein
MARKSWSEKFADKRPREVKPAPKDFADIKAGQMMLLTTPHDVAAVISSVSKGKQLDLKGLRARLARSAGAEIACPIVTGIHLRTVAEMTGEQLDAGVPAKSVVPVWRIVGPRSPVWKKLENGRTQFEKLRRAEKLED